MYKLFYIKRFIIKLNTKILFSFSFTILLYIIITIVSVFHLNTLSTFTTKMYEHPYTVSNSTNNIKESILKINIIIKDFYSTKNILHIKNIKKLEFKVAEQYQIIFDKYLGDKKDITQSHDIFINWSNRTTTLLNQIRVDSNYINKSTLDKERETFDNLLTSINKLINYAQKKATFFKNNALEKSTSAITDILILGVLIILVSITLLYFLLKNINKVENIILQSNHLLDQNIMIVTFDKNFKIIDVTSSLCRFIKYSKEELLYLNDGFSLYEDCDNSIQDDIKLTIQSGESWSGEIKKLSKTDNLKWMYVNIQPILDDNFNIKGYKNIYQDISSKKKMEDISNMDGLTDLYNRRFFDNTFPNQIKIAKRNNSLLAFGMIDIDNFKKYNDTYGHKAGDSTLKDVAYMLSHSLKRPDDYVFRLGGEEFGILFATDNHNHAIKLAKRVIENIETRQIEHSQNDVSNYVTISMGLYIIEVDEINDSDTIYELADRLLYKAKRNGRNQVVFQENIKEV